MTLSEEANEHRRTAGEIFDDALPYCLTWGMTPEQYWDGDNDLPRIYHRKYLIEQEAENRRLHRLGAYIYETLARLQPFFIGFPADEKMTRQPYLAEPLPTSEEDAKEQEKRRKLREFEDFREQLLAYAEANNEKYKEGGD